MHCRKNRTASYKYSYIVYEYTAYIGVVRGSMFKLKALGECDTDMRRTL